MSPTVPAGLTTSAQLSEESCRHQATSQHCSTNRNAGVVPRILVAVRRRSRLILRSARSRPSTATHERGARTNVPVSSQDASGRVRVPHPAPSSRPAAPHRASTHRLSHGGKHVGLPGGVLLNVASGRGGGGGLLLLLLHRAARHASASTQRGTHTRLGCLHVIKGRSRARIGAPCCSRARTVLLASAHLADFSPGHTP